MVGAGRFAAVPSLFAVTAVLFAAVGVAGCADTVIDSTKTEEAVQADIEKSFHEKISAVECPSEQKVEPGETFTCTVDYANGKSATVTLKIRNSAADLSMVGLSNPK